MADQPVAYVLDSHALLAHFEAEPGGLLVRGLLEAARDQAATLYVSLINAGELYYITHRERGVRQAETLLADLRELPVTLSLVSEERIFAAARIKAEYSISYADAFAAALAQELSATLVTGDPSSRPSSLSLL